MRRPASGWEKELAGASDGQDGGATTSKLPPAGGVYSPDAAMGVQDDELVPHHAPAQGATVYLECEDFQGTWKAQTNVTGYSGRGFVVSNTNAPGTSAMSSVASIPTSGIYTVWARGFEGGGADRSWQIGIGLELLPATHAGKDVPARYTWQRAGVVTLDAGTVPVRVIDVGDSYEIADAIVLTLDPAFDPGLDEARWRVLSEQETAGVVQSELVARAQGYAQQLPAPGKLEDWQLRAAELRPKVLRALGLDPLPPSTALNAEVLGSTQMGGYRIERVSFESRPGRIVPANVYVPDGAGPFPIVLTPLGHWADGKSHPTPAALNHSLARLGYISISYDPFGQGELRQVGNYHDEHWRLVLSGHTNMSVLVWNTRRALDYMLTRGDADGSMPIACTGASGGGLNTLLLSILDPRIQVSIPVVYVATFESFMSTDWVHCPCSNPPGLAAITDMGEMAALFAPRPQLIMNALDDTMFPDEGVQAAVAGIQPIYGLHEADDSLGFASFPGDHDYGQAMRERTYGFLARHVKHTGDGSPVPEPTFTPLAVDSPVFTCFPKGASQNGSKLVRDLARQWAEEAAAALPTVDGFDAKTVRSSLIEVMHMPAETSPIVEERGEVEVDGMKVMRLRIEVQSGMSLAAHHVSAGSHAPAVLLIDDFAGPWACLELLRQARDRGLSALCFAPRGQGETVWPDHEQAFVSDNMLLGDPALGQRAFDVRQALRALRALPGTDTTRIGLVAVGKEAALPAFFAQAMWAEFDAVAVGPVFGTYFNPFEDREVPLMAYVPRMLQVADIPHVAALASQRPLLVAFDGDLYKQREPAWAAYIGEHAEVAPSVTPGAALDWISGRLSTSR